MSPQRYRDYAAECIELAKIVTDPGARSRLYLMAMAWSELAHQAGYQPVQQQQQPQKDAPPQGPAKLVSAIPLRQRDRGPP